MRRVGLVMSSKLWKNYEKNYVPGKQIVVLKKTPRQVDRCVTLQYKQDGYRVRAHGYWAKVVKCDRLMLDVKKKVRRVNNAPAKYDYVAGLLQNAAYPEWNQFLKAHNDPNLYSIVYAIYLQFS